MRSVFLADAHLSAPGDPGYRELLPFLKSLEGNTETLYILGDLFEFWIGYPAAAFPHYRSVLDALLELKRSGTAIVYFEGNHDFHLGPFFRETLGAAVHPVAADLAVDGMRFHLCHGDQASDRELAPRLLRLLLHSRLTKGLLRIVPPSAAFRLAEVLSSRSRRGRDGKPPGDIAGIIRKYAAGRFREGAAAVVLGHFHLPLLERGEGVLMAVGDWENGCCYGELEGGVLRLCRWPDGVSAELAIPNSSR